MQVCTAISCERTSMLRGAALPVHAAPEERGEEAGHQDTVHNRAAENRLRRKCLTNVKGVVVAGQGREFVHGLLGEDVLHLCIRADGRAARGCEVGGDCELGEHAGVGCPRPREPQPDGRHCSPCAAQGQRQLPQSASGQGRQLWPDTQRQVLHRRRDR
jgi:hypothetical protein